MMSLKTVVDLASKWVVLEPLIFLFSLNNMNNVPIQNIYLEKFTEILGNNNQTDSSDLVQRHTSDFIRNKTDKLGLYVSIMYNPFRVESRSTSNEARLSLVESFIAAILCHKDTRLPCTERSYYGCPNAIKNQ